MLSLNSTFTQQKKRRPTAPLFAIYFYYYTGCLKQSSRFLATARNTSRRVMIPTNFPLSITGYTLGLPDFIMSASSIIDVSGPTESTCDAYNRRQYVCLGSSNSL